MIQKVGHGAGRVGGHALYLGGGTVVQGLHRVVDRDLAGMIKGLHGLARNFRRADFQFLAEFLGLHPGQEGEQNQRQDFDGRKQADEFSAHAHAEIRQFFFKARHQRQSFRVHFGNLHVASTGNQWKKN
ncbi:MAG: hypothetical protein ACLU98_14785 [Desulfovibrio fairfieldensis]